MNDLLIFTAPTSIPNKRTLRATWQTWEVVVKELSPTRDTKFIRLINEALKTDMNDFVSVTFMTNDASILLRKFGLAA